MLSCNKCIAVVTTLKCKVHSQTFCYMWFAIKCQQMSVARGVSLNAWLAEGTIITANTVEWHPFLYYTSLCSNFKNSIGWPDAYTALGSKWCSSKLYERWRLHQQLPCILFSSCKLYEVCLSRYLVNVFRNLIAREIFVVMLKCSINLQLPAITIWKNIF